MARIAVLKGGTSMEREVSLVTGRRVELALERLGHEVDSLDVEDDTTARLIELEPDAVFICLHGVGGEDGTVQALLETLGLPYTGSGPLASSRSLDKDYSKRLLSECGIPTPEFRSFGRRVVDEMGASAALELAAGQVGYPLAVKPARQGSSMGLSRVESRETLIEAVYEAFAYDRKIVLERWLEGGTEVLAPILHPHGEEPRVLEMVEVRPREGQYNFEAMYTPGMTDFAIPAEVSPEAARKLQQTALKTYEVLGCAGFGRVDMVLVDGEPHVLDVNTIPGFTETSTLPLAAEAAGVGFEELVETIVEDALQRETTTL